MSMEIRIIEKEEYTTSTWSGGKTTQLFIYPEDADYAKRDFKFRLSSATVELEESEFTKLEGVYRFITPLDSCLRLTHDGKKIIDLQPFEIYEFDGGVDTTSFGKATDFNLMLKDGAEGILESITIDKELCLEKELNGDFKEFFLFLYACNEPLSVEFEGNVFNLNQSQTFLIQSSQKGRLNLCLKSKAKANILVASIAV